MRKEQRQCSSMLKSTTKPVDIYAPAKVVPTEDFCQCGVPWCKIYVEKWLVRVQCLNGHTPADHLLTRTRLDQTERQMNVLRAFGIKEILKSVGLAEKSPSARIAYAAEEELLQRNTQEEAEKDLHEAPTSVHSYRENKFRQQLLQENKNSRKKRPHHSDPDTDW